MIGKPKVSLIALEVLIAIGILAIPLIRFGRLAKFIDFSTPVWAASTGNAMMSYWDAGAADYDLPRYRTWNGSSWSNEATAQDINSSPYWIVLRSCPKRNEKILGTQDATSASEDIEVQLWNGTTQTWGNYKKVSDDAGTATKRAFDIAYEQSSGDAIVVFGVDTLTTPKYFSWNGSAWGTTAEDCAAIGAGEIYWIKLASKPGADEIVLVTSDTNKDIYAQVWDGSAWGNAVLLTDDADVLTAPCFDIAYEQLNKRAIIVYTTLYGDDDVPRYSIWDNGAWGTGGNCSARGTGDQRLVKMAAKPGSNEIMMATLDELDDINTDIWYSAGTTNKDTAQWSHMVEVETAAVPS